MTELAKKVSQVNIEEELRQSYLDYAMSVIVGRALPDVRDGLKPVHRRALFAMHELGNDWNKPYKKSARIVGDVIGKYHPHGDGPVYDTIVRMAQPFSLRYLLIDGQGNFGSVDGDPPAAMRYTEVRMSKLAHRLIADLDKKTVDFVPNYDGSEQAPVVMPTQIPNLLINGSSGIAVGMATNIPPHNLGEVIDACIGVLRQPAITLEELMEHLPGPDFPTSALINGRLGILQAYRTGRGKIYIRSRANIEEDSKGKQTIIVTELPYQVNKARMVEKIANLVKEGKVEGITALRDESDKNGIRVVIEVRRGEIAEVILNKLYAYTQLESVYGINMVALVDGQPRLMNLKTLIEAFLRHRREVVTRRTIYELNRARDRAHILEGLAVALGSIDPIIALIKQSSSPQDAKQALLATAWPAGSVSELLARCDRGFTQPADVGGEYGLQSDGVYRLSSVQAQAILDLKLHRLTALEQDKIVSEYDELVTKMRDLSDILSSQERLVQVIEDELLEVKTQFADSRRTEIVNSKRDLEAEDLITPDTMVVTISQSGYVKTQSLSTYSAQRRGGRGKSATMTKEEDVVDQLLIANTHDTLLCFSTLGKLYWLKVYQLPQASRVSRGRPIVNLLPLSEGERISSFLPVREYLEDHYVFMATRKGLVKKTALKDFSRPRAKGINAVDLSEDDTLVGAVVTDGQAEIMLFASHGKSIRFHEQDVRPMGRGARGVRGIKLGHGSVISMLRVEGDGDILTATERGFGKRTALSDYGTQSRGGMGMIAITTSERNGAVVAAAQVTPEDEVVLITDKGTLVRTRVDEISVVGRAAQGVKLINLQPGETLTCVQRVDELELGSEVNGET